jgi:hypothetical protein
MPEDVRRRGLTEECHIRKYSILLKTGGDLMKKVGIVCSCSKLNYGSVLQSYALCEIVKNLGYECNFVWTDNNLFKHYNIRKDKCLGTLKNVMAHPYLIPELFKSVWNLFVKKSGYHITEVSTKFFDEFKRNNLKICLYDSKDLLNVEGEYSAFICGSDQIWNTYEYWLDPLYFLRFTTYNKRIAYAPSLGIDGVSKYNKKTFEKYVKDIKYVSVRENSSKVICEGITGEKIPVVLDPTLLITGNDWKKKLDISCDIATDDSEKYVLFYFLSEPSDAAIKAAKKLSDKYIIKIIPYEWSKINNSVRVDVGPREFVSLVNSAEMILTDSFHGTIFSVNFNVSVWIFERNYNGESQSTRITSILSDLGLSERLVCCNDIEGINLFENIDYSEVNKKLINLRNESMQFLSKALEECADETCE